MTIASRPRRLRASGGAPCRAVAAAVGTAIDALGAGADEVELVLVKCPLLTSERVARCLAAGAAPVTTETYESMAASRRASALGVAVALGECSRAQGEHGLTQAADVWSSVASVSSGAELENCQILILAGRRGHGRLRARHTVMADALDMASVAGLLADIDAEGGRVVQLFAKAEPTRPGACAGAGTRCSPTPISTARATRAPRSAACSRRWSATGASTSPAAPRPKDRPAVGR